MPDGVQVDVRDGSRCSPLHIHLTDEMPVHVHVKREKSPAAATALQGQKGRHSYNVSFRTGILNTDSGFKSDSGIISDKSRKTMNNRSRSNTKVHSVRPQQLNKSLNTKLIRSASERRSKDQRRQSSMIAASDDEQYARVEKTTKTDPRQTDNVSNRYSTRRTSDLDATYRLLDEELKEYEDKINRDIQAADAANRKLKRSVERLDRLDDDPLLSSSQNDKIQRKLLEVEMESEAIARQVSALIDTISFLKQDKRMAAGDSSILMKQKDLLEDRLERFCSGSNALRKLMTYQQDHDVIAVRLADQRDKLLERLAKTQNNQQDIVSQLLEKDEEIADLIIQLNAQKDECIALQSQHSSVSATKAHLQKQLKQKDADCNRLSVQIRTLEAQLAQERVDVEHLRSLLVQARKKPDEDKEALKKATRVQKLRAARSEDAIEEMRTRLLDSTKAYDQLKLDMDAIISCNTKLISEKEQALADITALRGRLSDLEGLMERQDDRSRQQVSKITTRLDEKSAELSALRRDNDSLRSMCALADKKMAQKEEQFSELTAKLREYQTLVDKYRHQMEDESGELTEARGRELRSEDEVKTHNDHLLTARRRLSQLEDENRDLIGANAKREEAVKQMNARLEEKLEDNARLERQLQSANSELRRLKDVERERSSNTERTLQSKMLELEAQLGHAKSEINKLKRDRDETERKFNSKLYDLKDRLEQSHATNRSLQTYVQFLKNSYTSAFNDATLGPTTSTPLRPASGALC